MFSEESTQIMNTGFNTSVKAIREKRKLLEVERDESCNEKGKFSWKNTECKSFAFIFKLLEYQMIKRMHMM